MQLHSAHGDQPITLVASLVGLHLFLTHNVHPIRVRVVLRAGNGLRQKLQLLATFRMVVVRRQQIAFVQTQLVDRFVTGLARGTLKGLQFATQAAPGVRFIVGRLENRIAAGANALGTTVSRFGDRVWLVADRDGVGILVVGKLN